MQGRRMCEQSGVSGKFFGLMGSGDGWPVFRAEEAKRFPGNTTCNLRRVRARVCCRDTVIASTAGRVQKYLVCSVSAARMTVRSIERRSHFLLHRPCVNC